MAKHERLYRRLPGRSRHWMGASTLWLGPDHLLLVSGRGYTERYHRFYYRDIAAIVTRGTEAAWIWTAVLGLLLLGVAFAMAGTASDARPWWLILGGPLLLLFLINVLLGPSCVAHITTPIQTAALPMRRWRAARKALALIRERVAAAQSGLAAAAPREAGGAPGAAP